MFSNIQFIAIVIALVSTVVLVVGQRGTLGAFRGLAKAAIVPALLVFAALFCVQQVPAGHVKVATLFGKVQDQVYEEGLHFPVNPLYAWNEYDVRQHLT